MRVDVPSHRLPLELGIEPGSRLSLIGPTSGFETVLTPLPPDVELLEGGEPQADTVLVHMTDAQAIEDRVATAHEVVDPAGRIWVVWSTRSSDPSTTDRVLEAGRDLGLVDATQTLIEETWMAVELVSHQAECSADPPSSAHRIP